MIARFELRQASATAGAGAIVVEASGEVDATNAPALRDALGAIESGPPLVLDLSDMEYFDSAGFEVLDWLLGERPTAVVIAPASVLRRAAKLLALPLHDDVAQALTALSDGQRAGC